MTVDAWVCNYINYKVESPLHQFSHSFVLMGRIHGAIVAATGRSDCRDNCRRDDRPVYTLQIVAATIASWLLD